QLADALRAVQDRQLADVPERLRRLADDLRELLGDLLADDRLLVAGERVGARLDRLRLGEALRLHGVTLGETASLRRRGFGVAHRRGARRGRAGCDLPALRVAPRLQLDLARLRLRLRDASVARCLGDRARLVRLGIGRLAHLGLELLLGALRLELGDLRLL